MNALLWHLANPTPETLFIFSLFHLLLAGLTLLVLLRHLGPLRASDVRSDRLLVAGFLLLALHVALRTLFFGARFFLDTDLTGIGAEPVSRGLLRCALLLIAGGYAAARGEKPALARWFLGAGTVVALLMPADLAVWALTPGTARNAVRAAVLAGDVVVWSALARATLKVRLRRGEARAAIAGGLVSAAMSLALLDIAPVLSSRAALAAWSGEQHLLLAGLFAFAWAAGERSHDLLDRMFVRLNLTFIVLAELVMLVMAGMERFQYLHLAEQRSLELAEFLRGRIVYARARKASVEDLLRQPEIMRRVVVEFGRLPELRQVNVSLAGMRTSFSYTPDREVKEAIVPANLDADLPANGFRMIRLPIGGDSSGDGVELVGTKDFINQNIGKNIILIYSVSTIVVVLATGLIGIMVADADRRLRRQYLELQETQAQLAEAAKLASIGQLAGGVAHEINTPITSILALASHLAEGAGAATLAPPQRQSLRVIVGQAQRVSSTVRSLLTTARQSHLELSDVDVVQPLEAALTVVQFRLGGAFVVRREIDRDLPSIIGDAGRLTEVFVNLITNALDAMPGGGTLVIRAKRDTGSGGGVRIEVADTGCGIPAGHLPRIFDPFFTTKEPGQGTGLGLSISHGIVKDHGGRIWAHSAPGAGTTLTIALPKETSRDAIAHSGHR